MDAEDKIRLQIKGVFSKESLALGEKPGKKSQKGTRFKTYEIPPHAGFEIVELPYDGKTQKLAYNNLYDLKFNDFEIECKQIGFWETAVRKSKGNSRIANLKRLKFHYKQAIALLSVHPEATNIAGGWNRWSDNILDLFISGKMHRILWGSGNCGKSSIYGILLYIKWRVRPNKRMIVVASRIMQEAKERVFAYIKEAHASAPPSSEHSFRLIDAAKDKGIYCQILDKNTGKLVRNDRGCIVVLPIKIQGETRELGANLMGKHPDDMLVIAFDEAQELPSDIADMKIFLNWYTNPRMELHAWGNPSPIDYHNKESWDLLFRLGAGSDSIETIKKREMDAKRTTWWTSKNTTVLHLSMLDSPRDDPEEVDNMRLDGLGNQQQRLHFLAGKENARVISENTTPNSPAWFSQVLGFPLVNLKGSGDRSVLSAAMVQAARDYPLKWLNEEANQWYLSADPSLGDGDDAAIVCGERGLMRDGRMGIDLHNGKFCLKVRKREGQDFTDTIIEEIYRLSILLKIPLDRISLETHGTGEVLRYAIHKHIEAGKWRKDYDRGLRWITQQPARGVTDRPLYRILGQMEPAKNIVGSYATELCWAVRCAVLSRQLFNVPEFILEQYYTRYLKKNTAGSKYILETKEEMKNRGQKSPNDMDALNGLLDMMRIKGFRFSVAHRHEYKDRFGDDYLSFRERKDIGKAFGMVSRALQMNINLGGYDDDPRLNRDGKLVKKTIGRFNVPVI